MRCTFSMRCCSIRVKQAYLSGIVFTCTMKGISQGPLPLLQGGRVPGPRHFCRGNLKSSSSKDSALATLQEHYYSVHPVLQGKNEDLETNNSCCSWHGFLYIRGWMQMVMATNDLFSWNNKYNEYNVTKDIYTLSSWSYARQLTLCMLAFWSHEGVVFLDFLPSPHLVTSLHLPCLGSTDAHCPRLGDPVPLLPKWRPFPQGPHTLPYRGSEQLLLSRPVKGLLNKLY